MHLSSGEMKTLKRERDGEATKTEVEAVLLQKRTTSRAVEMAQDDALSQTGRAFEMTRTTSPPRPLLMSHQI